MKKYFCVLLSPILATLLLNLAGCAPGAVLKEPPIMPKPTSSITKKGEFVLTSNSRIVIKAGNSYHEVKRNIAEYLADILRASTGFDIIIADDNDNPKKGDIALCLDNLNGLPAESYTIKVEKRAITLRANEPAGLFRAVQTLRQLFGPDIEGKYADKNKKWSIACVEITDSPAYQYRGLMIDAVRHFFSKEIIMRQIDLAAQYKINKFHFHLTDDQGWRIEIKSRPALTEIGSLGAVEGGTGGYFTQDDFKEIVEYAAARYIEVIPEIEMPGHINAALVSIPELNPDGKAATPITSWATPFTTLQARSEITYQFVDDVIRELAEISPSKYIHIGGDEADATSPDDYSYFIGRVSEIVKKYGKTTIGWTPYERADGILEDAAVQNWLCDNSSYYTAREKDMAMILSPAQTYLDQKYNAGTRLGLQWRGFVNLETSYNWLPAWIGRNNKLLGIESALWAESIATESDIDYMLYPRLMANAEVGWTAETNRNFADFMDRLPAQFARLDVLGVGYSRDYE